MISLIKTTIKLLMRNKGFIFFLLITPILSSVILGMKFEASVYQEKDSESILELETADSQALYIGDNYAYIVKVYDGAKTELSEYVLRSLAENGLFCICRADVRGFSYDEIRAQAEKDGYNDRCGIIMYLKSDFDTAVMNDTLANGMELFITSEDERTELFETELRDKLGKIYLTAGLCGQDSAKTIEMLDQITGKIPEKKVTEITGEDSVSLNDQQKNSSVQIGYAFAIITLGFMFSGVFAAHTVITEENNKVFTRYKLTGRSTAMYFTAKFITVVLMSALQTGVLAVCLMFMKNMDLGISMPMFLLIIFLLGRVIGTFAMLTGILFGDIMSSVYAAFAIWSISAMLSGLLFPIDDTAKVLKAISYLMPQRWFMDSTEKILAGLGGAYPTLICVTAAYLVIIVGIGSVGLKMKKQPS